MIDKDRLIEQAKSLQENEAFKFALSEIRVAALEQLVATDAEDVGLIRDHQAIVKVVDALRGRIDRLVKAPASRKASVV